MIPRYSPIEQEKAISPAAFGEKSITFSPGTSAFRMFSFGTTSDVAQEYESFDSITQVTGCPFFTVNACGA